MSSRDFAVFSDNVHSFFFTCLVCSMTFYSSFSLSFSFFLCSESYSSATHFIGMRKFAANEMCFMPSMPREPHMLYMYNEHQHEKKERVMNAGRPQTTKGEKIAKYIFQLLLYYTVYIYHYKYISVDSNPMYIQYNIVVIIIIILIILYHYHDDI